MKVLEFAIPFNNEIDLIIGAGVLLYAVHDQRIYFLLGQETNDYRFGVFGGRIKPGVGIVDTAINEFEEETLGAVMPRSDLARILHSRLYTLKFVGAAGLNRYFVTFMVRIPFDPHICTVFANTRSGMIQGRLRDTIPGCVDHVTNQLKYDYLEKRELRWFLSEDIFNIALRSRWNRPVTGIAGSPMFRRPFLSGLHAVIQYFNMDVSSRI